MKKKSIITIGTSLAMLFGLFMGTTGSAIKTVGVKASVPSGSTGTLSTDFNQLYDDSEATPDTEYMKVLDSSTNIPLYKDGVLSSYYSAVANKNTASENPKVRNYHNLNTTYYLYLKYCSTKTANTEGSNLIFSPLNDAFRITSISSSK